MQTVTKEYANQKTNRHIGRCLGALKDAGFNVPDLFADNIKSYFHFLKKDLTPELEWENETNNRNFL